MGAAKADDPQIRAAQRIDEAMSDTVDAAECVIARFAVIITIVDQHARLFIKAFEVRKQQAIPNRLDVRIDLDGNVIAGGLAPPQVGRSIINALAGTTYGEKSPAGSA